MSLKLLVESLQKKGLRLINQYSNKIIGLLIASVIGIGAYLAISSNGENQNPKDTAQFANTSVKIMNREMTSGGSGVILRSKDNYSEILTNKHVCRLIQDGGVIVHKNKILLVDQYKKYDKHDLCMIKVFSNLHVSTNVAKAPPRYYSSAFISGHPALLPHVLTTGSFSDKEIISLIVGMRPCKEEDYRGQFGMYCVFMGGFPIIESFVGQLVTGTILPGSSGSGVFNSNGEISGLVFAGRGDGLGYAFVVPHEYVVDFLSIEKEIPYKEAKGPKDEMIYSIFGKSKACRDKSTDSKFQSICDTLQNYLIWSK